MCVLFVAPTESFSQNGLDNVKAESSVMKFMSMKNKRYLSYSFGELFKQTYPKEIQNKLKTGKKIEYSIIHTYKIDKHEFKNVYFHLDSSYNVIGFLTEQETDEVSLIITKAKLDSLEKTIPIPKE